VQSNATHSVGSWHRHKSAALDRAVGFLVVLSFGSTDLDIGLGLELEGLGRRGLEAAGL